MTVDLASVQFEKINTAFGVAIVNQAHRLASARMLQPGDFAGENFISLPAGSFNREQIDRHFPDGSRVLSIETPYATTICSMVEQGLGVAIINPVVVSALKPTGIRAIEFSKPVEFHSYVIHADAFPTSLMARKMVECVRTVFADMRM